MRRSYGDTILNNEGGLIEMTGLDRFIALDLATGALQAEAGATLSDIMRLIVPHGFFLPVTPGTRFVTLGGAIANDVHGKNHHCAGTFGRHVTRLSLLRSDGSRVEIGPDSDLFAATVGGMGLTGIIEWAEVKLQRILGSQINVETIPYDDLSAFWELAGSSTVTHEHTMAWMDSSQTGGNSGRGIFFRGNWSSEGGLRPHVDHNRLNIPFEAPSGLLNGLTMSLFNRLSHALQRRKPRARSVHYASFFHPLDRVANWNRLYGRRGFWQYQCVVPPSTTRDAIPSLLREVSRSGHGSSLAVLKTFGDLASPGLVSFPMAGTTLAIDFPNRPEKTLRLFSRLDAIVRDSMGRLYPAKDGRIPEEMWGACYPQLDRFMAHLDPAFASNFWRRVAP